MENCIFCKIIKSDIPSFKVYEDEHSLGFLDIYPGSTGHTLVIPKEHHENIYSLPPEVLARLSLSVQKIAVAAKNALEADGIKILMNNEECAGQVIFHAHFHVIPRFKDDEYKEGSHKEYMPGEAESIAEQIRKSLNS